MTLPMTMRVARLHAWGDVRVEEAAVPRPGPGEVVVRIDACGVCGSDALDWYVASKAPTVLGHEPAGTIAAAGTGARGREGDRVFVHHHAPCMTCAECRRGLWSNCATWRATRLDPGGFAEYARVQETIVRNDMLVLPDALDSETATFVEPVACCIRAVQRHGQVGEDDTVLIIGLGAMGLVMTRLARLAGARVFGTDFLPERRALAERSGASAAFAPDALGDALRGATEGRGADVVIVCPADDRALAAGIDAAAPGARVVCFTPFPPGRTPALDAHRLYFREIALLQSYSCGPDETRAALDLLVDGSLDVRPLVTHRAGLEGVGDALIRAKTPHAGIKTVILPGATP